MRILLFGVALLCLKLARAPSEPQKLRLEWQHTAKRRHEPELPGNCCFNFELLYKYIYNLKIPSNSYGVLNETIQKIGRPLNLKKF